MSDTPVTSVAIDTTLSVSVTSAYAGDGAAVDHSTASVSATIKNLSPSDDIWYRIDSGAWSQLTERQSADITIDFDTQMLTLKRGEFTSASIPVQVIAYGAPIGLYARGRSLGGSVTEEALAALGVYPGWVFKKVPIAFNTPNLDTTGHDTGITVEVGDLMVMFAPYVNTPWNSLAADLELWAGSVSGQQLANASSLDLTSPSADNYFDRWPQDEVTRIVQAGNLFLRIPDQTDVTEGSADIYIEIRRPLT